MVDATTERPKARRMQTAPLALLIVSLLGSALVAGTFFAFSAFVMRGLATTPDGLRAMQSINVVVINPWFMAAFMGTTLLAAASTVLALYDWQHAGSGWLLAAGLLYGLGTFGVTAAANVPLNDQLAKVQPPGEAEWSAYVVTWTRWNTVRCIAASAATIAWAMALRRW